MPALIDIISPVGIGEDKIVLNIDEDSLPVQTFKPIQINVDYSEVGQEGISVPLELIIQPASNTSAIQSGYVSKIYRRVAPNRFLFRPLVAGSHLILLKEIHHNRYQGRLIVDVAGDKFAEPIVRTRS